MVQVAREVVVGGWQAREEVLAGRYEGCGRWLQPQTAWMEASPMKFGQVVWVKSKKDLGPFDPRWECGRYISPADDVREGHVVRLDDGTWMRTLSMRVMRDEEYEEQAEEAEEDYVVDHV